MRKLLLTAALLGSFGVGLAIAQPIDLTTQLTKFLVDLRSGTFGSNQKFTALRVSNGTNSEYAGIDWVSNFANIGTVTNSGTGRAVRIQSSTSGSTVLIAPNGSDAFAFNATGATIFSGLVSVQRGVPVIVGYGEATAQAAANASVATFTVGAADGLFEVSANVLVTTATTHTFNVECAYTDDGNTARTIIMPFRLVGDTTAVTSSVANGNGAVPYNGIPLTIKAKTATAITIRTQAGGVYTTVAYNIRGLIKQAV